MEEAVRLAREHELARWLPRTLGNLADVEMAEGKLDQARAHSEEALALGSAASSNVVVSLKINLAHLACLERRHADAVELAQEVLDQALAIGSRIHAAAGALRLAWSFAELQQPERAARLLGTALEFYRRTGIAMEWSDAICDRAIRDALGAQLDERALHALVEEGRAMTLEQAVQKECHDAEQRA